MNTSRYSQKRPSESRRIPSNFVDVADDLKQGMIDDGFDDVSFVDVLDGLGKMIRGDFHEFQEELRYVFENDNSFSGWQANGHRKKKI